LQKLFNLMISHLPILPLISWPVGVLQVFPSNSFKVSSFTLRSLTHLNWIDFCIGIWISSFPYTIC
jgi:uncharacterized membrane protein YdjX (TVP38/TMEM64 family)